MVFFSSLLKMLEAADGSLVLLVGVAQSLGPYIRTAGSFHISSMIFILGAQKSEMPT